MPTNKIHVRGPFPKVSGTFPYRESFFRAGKVRRAFAVLPLASHRGPVGGDEPGGPGCPGEPSCQDLCRCPSRRAQPPRHGHSPGTGPVTRSHSLQQFLHSNVCGTGKTPPVSQDCPSPLMHLLLVPLGSAPVPSPETHVSHPCWPPWPKSREQPLHLGALSGPHQSSRLPGPAWLMPSEPPAGSSCREAQQPGW